MGRARSNFRTHQCSKFQYLQRLTVASVFIAAAFLSNASYAQGNAPAFPSGSGQPNQAPKFDSLSKQLYDTYLFRAGKISSSSITAAIELVATRSGRDWQFRDMILQRLENAYLKQDQTVPKRTTLRLLRKMLDHQGWERRNYELRTNRKGLPQQAQARESNPQSLYRNSSELARLIRCGHQSDSTTIDAFVLAMRAAHHPQCVAFLRDVLANENQASPFAPNPPVAGAPPAPKSKWADASGGSWRDARFHAAIALAELNDRVGIQWLINRAAPGDTDDSVFRGLHWSVPSGSTRQSCQAALADLSGLRGEQLPSSWAKWFTEHVNSPRHAVQLKLD